MADQSPGPVRTDVDVDLTIAPVEDNGEVTHYVAIERDVTEPKRDDQRLEVFNRVLRHNVRNAVTVVDGNARRIGDQCDDAAVQTLVERITSWAGNLRSAVEKVRTVERAIASDRSDAMNVRTLFTTVHDSTAAETTTASVAVDVPTDLWVIGNHTLKAAIEEAIHNAVEHGGTEPTITVGASIRSDDRVDITVADDGPGVPDYERQVLETGEESDLNHGSGLGLWVMQWVVTSLGGDVTITDGADGGTVVTFTLPRADQPTHAQPQLTD